jgi:hypothetical protein
MGDDHNNRKDPQQLNVGFSGVGIQLGLHMAVRPLMIFFYSINDSVNFQHFTTIPRREKSAGDL